jgi:hypothetical protein
MDGSDQGERRDGGIIHPAKRFECQLVALNRQPGMSAVMPLLGVKQTSRHDRQSVETDPKRTFSIDSNQKSAERELSSVAPDWFVAGQSSF